MGKILIHCRAGFENDAAAETMAWAEALQVDGYVKAQPQQAYLLFIPQRDEDGKRFLQQIDFKRFIFARQLFWVEAELNALSEQDRITPMLTVWQKLGIQGQDVFVEYADSEAGRELSTFCRKFTVPLRQKLKQNKMFHSESAYRWQVLFLDSKTCFVGYAVVAQSSPHTQGIPRLKFPSAAPSRSTLKLEEALLAFIPAAEQSERLKEGMLAVDLGACPGGWTYQLLRRGVFVFAVDHGKIAPSLLQTGLVEYCPEDGFKFTPPPHHRIQWLVCDMVERPQRVMALMEKWLRQQWCREAIFNLKLPMKKRFQEVQTLLNHLEEALQAAGLMYQWQAKHLYHDREEITVHVRLLS